MINRFDESEFLVASSACYTVQCVQPASDSFELRVWLRKGLEYKLVEQHNYQTERQVKRAFHRARRQYNG